jgi:hypothetical protein
MAEPPAAAPTTSAPIARPYFIPESVDYEALPEPVRRALVSIVGPAYQESVELATTAMERSAGNTLVFLLTLEVLHQFDVARALDFSTLAGADATQERDKLIEDHLLLVCVKEMSARFMLRLNALRQDPHTGPLRRLPLL